MFNPCRTDCVVLVRDEDGGTATSKGAIHEKRVDLDLATLCNVVQGITHGAGDSATPPRMTSAEREAARAATLARLQQLVEERRARLASGGDASN